ncbi:putative OTU-like cysteine protease [Plasmodium gaboni]|uniref:Putative OTU-like cysteine protease n=1 Tax=Plasmodium gaboni TaxID=647221 RepID=A0A151LL73_9APIC|nr:putative OTU-like cysteine protease [Plasmodium gaboni]KYN99694.1 putative OTU-like cysteine protease [Plasmodium gaboni]
MSKKKRANQQKRKKKTEKKKNNYNNIESERGGITYSLINDYHDTNFKKNFYIKSIRTDGNCLFRAVSDQLYNHEENYKEIRKKVVEHLLKNEELYKNFIEYDESYKSYIERISLDGTWGGQLELQAVGEIYKVNILIYQENGCILEIKNHSDDNKCIQLHYASSEHYNSVRFKNRALDNELKSILDLREILNNKEDNDSTKTFYETTENELTDENESGQSNNIKYIHKKCDENHREYYYNKLLKEEDNSYDFIQRKKNGYNTFSFSDYEDDNNLTSYNLLHKLHNNMKMNRKYGRSRSMPNINDKFLYFISKNNRNEKVESDSTIDNMNEKKSLEKKKTKKNVKRKINFVRYNSSGGMYYYRKYNNKNKNDDTLKSDNNNIDNNDNNDNNNNNNGNSRSNNMLCLDDIFCMYLLNDYVDREKTPIVRFYFDKSFYKYLCLSSVVHIDHINKSDNNKYYNNIYDTNIFNNNNSYYCNENYNLCHLNYHPNHPFNNNNNVIEERFFSNIGYLSHYEVKNNFIKYKKKDDEDFMHLYSEKILYNTQNSSHDILYNSSNVDDNFISPNSIKKKKKKNYLYDEVYSMNHTNINNSYNKTRNPFYSLYMKGDSSNDLNNKITTFKNNDNMNGNQINVNNMSVNNIILDSQSSCKKNIKCVNNLFINKERSNNYYSQSDRIFNIIIDEYVISMDSDLLCCYISNRYNNKLIKSKSSPEGKSEYNIDDNIYSTYNTHIIDNNNNRNNEIGYNNNINTSNINININIDNNNNNNNINNVNHINNINNIIHIDDRHNDNESRYTTSTNITKDHQSFLHLNSKDLSMKRKYQNKKLINMFSKDFYSKGLFQYLNADFILNDDNIKYIIPFFSNHNKINIFKKNIDSNDMYLYNYVMFYFYLNKDKILNKWKCSQNLYEEFLIKEKHKYYKFIKGRKYSSIRSRDEQGVKIISI